MALMKKNAGRYKHLFILKIRCRETTSAFEHVTPNRKHATGTDGGLKRTGLQETWILAWPSTGVTEGLRTRPGHLSPEQWSPTPGQGELLHSPSQVPTGQSLGEGLWLLKRSPTLEPTSPAACFILELPVRAAKDPPSPCPTHMAVSHRGDTRTLRDAETPRNAVLRGS